MSSQKSHSQMRLLASLLSVFVLAFVVLAGARPAWSVVGDPPPVINTIDNINTPAVNDTVGSVGDQVRVFGNNFEAIQTVSFNGVAATYTVNPQLTQVTVIVPAGAATGPIIITTDDGTARSPIFTIRQPVVTSFNPTSGGVGTQVTITGTGFTNASAVTFNGTAATFTVASDTSIITLVPQGATNGPIRVVTPNGAGQSTSFFIVLVPTPVPPPLTVTGFTPTSGAIGTSVVITGTGFSNPQFATGVFFNGTNAPNFTVNSNTQITAVVPPGATTGPITVVNSQTSDTSGGSFGILASPLSITAVNPNVGFPSYFNGVAASTVVITGRGFFDAFGNSGVTSVTFSGTGNNTVNAVFTVNSDTQIVTSVPGDARTGVIRVTTSQGTVTSSEEFVVQAVIDNFTPTRGAPRFTRVIIKGKNFLDPKNPVTGVKFNGTLASAENRSSFTVDSDTQITAVVPENSSTGRLQIVTARGGDGPVSFNTFTVDPVVPGGPTFIDPIQGSIVENASAIGRSYTVGLRPAKQQDIAPFTDIPPIVPITVRVSIDQGAQISAVRNNVTISGPFIDFVFPAGSFTTFNFTLTYAGDDSNQGITPVTVKATVIESNDPYYPDNTETSFTLSRVDLHGIFVTNTSTVLRTREAGTVPGGDPTFDIGMRNLDVRNNDGTVNPDFRPKEDVLVRLRSGTPSEGLISYRVLDVDNDGPGPDVANGLVSIQPIPQQNQVVLFAENVLSNEYYRNRHIITVSGVDDLEFDGDQVYSVQVETIVSFDPEFNNLDLTGTPTSIVFVNTDDETNVIQFEQPGFIFSPPNQAGQPLTFNAPTNLTTTETGTTAIFTVRLNKQPSANVTLTLRSDDTTEGLLVDPVTNQPVEQISLVFTPSNPPAGSPANTKRWDVQHTVTVRGQDDPIQDGNQSYLILAATSSADTTYNQIDPPDPLVTNIDNEAPGVTVAPTFTAVDEGGTTTFTVVLNLQPTSDVVINLRSSDTNVATINKTRLTFTPTTNQIVSGNTSGWNVPQTVTIFGVDNNQDDGDKPFTIIIDPAISSDPSYGGTINPTDVDGIRLDDEIPAIIVTPTTLTTVEGGDPETFTVKLATRPTADVTINLTNDNPAEGTIDKTTLTFTSANFATAQTVTVTPVDDAVRDGNITYSINVEPATSTDTSYNNLNGDDVIVTNQDNELAFSVTPLNLTIVEGGTFATFTVKLNARPTANVTVQLVSSDTSEGTVSPATLTFTPTNFGTAQTVRVTPVDDQLRDGNITFRITGTSTSTDGSYNNSSLPDVTVVTQDNDLAGITITPVTTVAAEGGTPATFTVKLNSRPSNTVTLNLAPSVAGQLALDRTSLVFTAANYASLQTVRVTAIDDFKKESTTSYYVVTSPLQSTDPSYGSINPTDVRVQVTDNDIASVVLSPLTGLRTSEKGGTAMFNVRLTSQPAGNVTVALASSDLSEGTLNKASLLFSPSTGQPISGNTSGWNVAQTVTVTGVDDAVEDGDVTFVIKSTVNSTDGSYNGFRTLNVVIVNADDGDDQTRPTVNIAQPGINSVQRTLSYATGTATDNKGLAKVTVRLYRYGDATRAAGYVAADGVISGTYNPAVHELLASGTGGWSLRLPGLQTGRYDIRATATDKAGNAASTTRTFFIDQVGPNIEITQPVSGGTYPSITQATGRITEAGGGTVGSASIVLFRYANASQLQASGYYNGTGFQGAYIQLPLTVAADGSFTFALPALSPGRYYVQVLATDNFGNSSRSGQSTFTVTTGGQATPGPTPVPTTVPTTVPGATFDRSRSNYLMSVPHMNGTDKAATTTVAQAFTTPPVAGDGTVNFRLRQFDPITQAFVELSNSSILVRGKGYFLEPVTTGTSLKLPANDATRKPLTDGTFDITLVRNSSISLSDPNNGLNLIGFPFDPARFTSADWNTATVIAPGGQVFTSPAAATSVMFPDLFEYDETAGGYIAATSLQPFKGYAVRTKVNGVIVRLTGTP